MERLNFGVLSLVLLVSSSNGFSGLQECSIEGAQCETDEINLIDSVSHVHSEEECRQICEDQQGCSFITFYDDDSSPFSNVCLMFQSCHHTVECTNCVTQNIECYRTCSRNIVGHMDENIIDMIPNTESELECRQLCSTTDKCRFYTYYLEIVKP